MAKSRMLKPVLPNKARKPIKGATAANGFMRKIGPSEKRNVGRQALEGSSFFRRVANFFRGKKNDH